MFITPNVRQYHVSLYTHRTKHHFSGFSASAQSDNSEALEQMQDVHFLILLTRLKAISLDWQTHTKLHRPSRYSTVEREEEPSCENQFNKSYMEKQSSP